jgi:murein DD-endopeptidase MepM/ murein hydrolase activator NlpD
MEINRRKKMLSGAFKNRRTVLLLPSSPEKKVMVISLPPTIWFVLCGLIAALPLLAGIGAWSLDRSKTVAEQAHQLGVNNHALRSKLDEQNNKMKRLSGELIEIREKARFIEKFLGLKGDGDHAGRIGQGGVELSPERVLSRLNRPSSKAHKAPIKHPATSAEIASLQTTDLYQLNSDLESIIGTLQERQERLDRMPSLSPVDPRESWLSSSFGIRTSPFTGKKQFHPGVDIAGSKGTPILAPAKGKVTFVGKNGSLGLCIEVDHNSSFRTTYGHLLKSSVKKGQQIQRGEIIGYMGDSGRSTGYHLHYEIEKDGKRINPIDFMMDWDEKNLLLAGD